MWTPHPVTEYRFDPKRRWRFDYAWPDQRVAVEVNGGVWSKGRHVRGTGYIRDMEKLNEAQVAGWIVLQFTPQQMKTWEAKETIERALAVRKVPAPVASRPSKSP